MLIPEQTFQNTFRQMVQEGNKKGGRLKKRRRMGCLGGTYLEKEEEARVGGVWFI